MIFDTSDRFLTELVNHNLYCKELGLFMYTYNDGYSVVRYDVDVDEAVELEQAASRSGEFWEAFLGPGGHIYDGKDGLALLDDYKSYDWIPV